MKSLSRFAALPREEKRILLSAALMLPVADMALRTFGFQKTQRFLCRKTAGIKPLLSSRADQLGSAQNIAVLVSIAARRSPYKATCLRQSLVSWWLLQRKGIVTTLIVGVGKEDGSFKAHAWIELNGTPIFKNEYSQMTYSSIYHTGSETAADHR